MQARLWVADSASGSIAHLVRELEQRGYGVERVAGGDVTAERIDELRAIGEGPDAILVALGEGTAPLRSLSALPEDLAVVAVQATAGAPPPVDALRLGADDALAAPVDADELALRLARAIERRRTHRGSGRRTAETGACAAALLGQSEALERVREQIARVAPGRATVLITGETGTGKELVAAAVHDHSPRRRRPFLKVNCAALPETLLESELFGYERGAFTGADHRRTGRFEEAHAGTLLLDEVGDMHPRTQAKVLRVLQEREFERLGGSRPIQVDVRILAATNQDLEALIAAGRFRADLFFRLNVISIHLPPLRERREDVAFLAKEFLREFSHEAGVPKRGFSPAALEALERQPWPGNVRELRNVVQRAVLMGDGPWIEPGDLTLHAPLPAPDVDERRATGRPRDFARAAGFPDPCSGSSPAVIPAPPLVLIPPEGVDYRDVERALLLAALERTGWVQKEAAALLRMSRRRLNYRIQRLGISHPSWRRNRPRGSGGLSGTG